MTDIHYLDTSAAVPIFVHESMTVRMQTWLVGQPAGTVATSLWVSTEFSAALAMKVRSGELDPETRLAVLAEWRRFDESEARRLEIIANHFSEAARIADRHELGLRAGDALHLAIASTADCTLVTLDKAMAKAARAVGMAVAQI